MHVPQTYKFVYDRGVIENLKEVLGPSPALWLIPTEPEGDGTTYRMNKSVEGKRKCIDHFYNDCFLVG
jgi:hypothetical protein